MDFYLLTIPRDSLDVLQKDDCFPATVYAAWLVYIYDLVMFWPVKHKNLPAAKFCQC